jgi:hypothetical protein
MVSPVVMCTTYHDAKAQAERTGQKAVVLLYAEVLIPGNQPYGHIHEDDTGANDTGCREKSTRGVVSHVSTERPMRPES